MLDIAEVAKRAGVPASTLRFYESKGLIAANTATGQRRRYPDDVLNRLALIALGQSAGLMLDEIATMILPNGTPDIDRALLSAKADEIDAQIHRLTAVREGLRHAAVCPAPSHSDCPKFQRLLHAAAVGSLDRVLQGGTSKR